MKHRPVFIVLVDGNVVEYGPNVKYSSHVHKEFFSKARVANTVVQMYE